MQSSHRDICSAVSPAHWHCPVNGTLSVSDLVTTEDERVDRCSKAHVPLSASS